MPGSSPTLALLGRPLIFQPSSSLLQIVFVPQAPTCVPYSLIILDPSMWVRSFCLFSKLFVLLPNQRINSLYHNYAYPSLSPPLTGCSLKTDAKLCLPRFRALRAQRLYNLLLEHINIYLHRTGNWYHIEIKGIVFCHLLALWLWANHLNTLRYNFKLNKMRVIKYLLYKEVPRI